MSRSRPLEELTNPCQYKVNWSSNDRQWKFYDRISKQNFLVPAMGGEGLRLVVLDMWNSVGGFHKTIERSIYGTEVKKVQDPITAYAGKQKIAEGTWSEIKALGIDKLAFAKIVYAMIKIEGEYKSARFEMVRASCGAWRELTDSIGGEQKLYGDVVISVKEAIEGKKGSVVFFTPSFSIVGLSLSDEAKEAALKLDQELQVYFDARGNRIEGTQDLVSDFYRVAATGNVEMSVAAGILQKLGVTSATGMTPEQYAEAVDLLPMEF